MPMVEALQRLGRNWEAWAWLRLITQAQEDAGLASDATAEITEAIGRELNPKTPWIKVDDELVRLKGSKQWPLPNWNSLEIKPREIADGSRDSKHVRFETVGEAAGLRFSYFNGTQRPSSAPRLYEVDGGGVGVLDYDADGWPDLWFTQGNASPDNNDLFMKDGVFRNLSDGKFSNVTFAARISETGFSQGIAVGDLDNDGFDDVIVANIGANRWFRNQGDGTFEELQVGNETANQVWTASVLLADVNGDGLPDCYEVNYLAGKHLFTRDCPDLHGHLGVCPPLMFDAELDRLWINRGDGTFEDASDVAGVSKVAGRGLGIVTLRDDSHSKFPSLFVANDVTENFLFRHAESQAQANTTLDEIALVQGTAVDSDGRPQASMGIAADDFNGDGKLDFFVTNFYDDWNTLYLQQDAGLFVDATRGSGLGEPSLLMLGFGTQGVDANLDGNPDLVVANGHLVNDVHHRVPYRMLPQFFLNRGNAQFDEIPAKSLGNYFTRVRLGRGLALIDFDRNGREDFAVTHLYEPVELVANRTETQNHYLTLKLRARTSSRDAFGAKVTVVTENGTRIRELVAGSGFQAANERQLIFGVGNSTDIQQLTIDWPSGLSQEFSVSAVDSAWFAVEGWPKLVSDPIE